MILARSLEPENADNRDFPSRMLPSTWASLWAAASRDVVRTLFEGDAWLRTIVAIIPPSERKRPLGTPVLAAAVAQKHKRRRSTRVAVAAARWRAV